MNKAVTILRLSLQGEAARSSARVRVGRLLLTSLASLFLAACQPQSPAVIVRDAWAGATPDGASIGAVYFQIEASQGDTLLSASSPMADRIEMHESSEENGMIKMRPLTSVALAPGKPFSFAPGGAHLMLIGLRAPLVPGMRSPLTLQLSKAGSLSVQVEVTQPGGP
jgi:copper(I)-binding protein